MSNALNIVSISLLWSSHGTGVYKILESFVAAGLTLLPSYPIGFLHSAKPQLLCESASILGIQLLLSLYHHQWTCLLLTLPSVGCSP